MNLLKIGIILIGISIIIFLYVNLSQPSSNTPVELYRSPKGLINAGYISLFGGGLLLLLSAFRKK